MFWKELRTLKDFTLHKHMSETNLFNKRRIKDQLNGIRSIITAHGASSNCTQRFACEIGRHDGVTSSYIIFWSSFGSAVRVAATSLLTHWSAAKYGAARRHQVQGGRSYFLFSHITIESVTMQICMYSDCIDAFLSHVVPSRGGAKRCNAEIVEKYEMADSHI